MEALKFQAAAEQVVDQVTGQLLARTAETVSPRPSIAGWDLPMIRSLPARLDDATMTSLEAVASSPLPPPEPCDERHFNQVLRVMIAALPKRSHDDLGGELLVNTYRRMLGHLPRGAINHVAERATATCQWFPTIAECLEMAKGWIAPPCEHRAVRDFARGRLGRERLARFDEAMAAIDAGEMTGEEIAALPERWRGMAVESGRVWALRDGSYAVRPIDQEERRERAAELIAANLL